MSLQGQVKWFDPKKGYGFITGPEGQDVFVHYSQIQGAGFRSLRDGESVTYDLVEGDKGFHAKDVTRVEANGNTQDDESAEEGSEAEQPANHNGE